MEIKNLITFVHVAEQNGFTRAAEVLGYTQSTVSFQIKQLEDELGCLLFERINHTITLTEKGKELKQYAHKIIKLSEELKQSISTSTEITGNIHVITPDSICEVMLTENYYDFYHQYPKISLKFSTADTDDMFKILDRNEADVIFTLDNHVYHQDYLIVKEEPVNMKFVTSANSKYAKKKNVKIEEIVNEPFILTEHAMGYRHSFDKALAKKSLQINPILEIGRTDLITNELEKGIGISFLPEFVTEKKVKEGTLCYIDVCNFEVDIWKQLIHHKNKWISDHLHAFLEYVIKKEFTN